jgi:hypothetical protein
MGARDQFIGRCAEVCAARQWTSSQGQVDVKLDGGRHQVIRIEYFEYEGRELARLITTIGSTERIRADRLTHALRMNYGLPHGALAVKDDMLVMVDTLVVAFADAPEIEASVLYLAEMADRMEQSIFGPDSY